MLPLLYRVVCTAIKVFVRLRTIVGRKIAFEKFCDGNVQAPRIYQQRLLRLSPTLKSLKSLSRFQPIPSLRHFRKTPPMFSQSKFWTRIRQTRELVANRIQEQLRNDRRKNIRRSLSMPTATEVLEDRTLLASFTVDTLVDENDGIGTGGVSLRDAIAAASDGDDITFSVQGTINLTNGELTIDNWTIIIKFEGT